MTIGFNEAGGSGAGLYARLTTSDVRLANVTIAQNISGGPGGGVSTPAGQTSIIRLKSSIVASNNSGDGDLYPDCDVFFQNSSFSLIGDTGPAAGIQCGVDGLSADMISSSPADLCAVQGQDFASVFPLLSISPAIDAGNCIDAFGDTLGHDQRGVGMPADGDGDSAAECDMGAFAYLPEPGLGLGLMVGVGALFGSPRRGGRDDRRTMSRRRVQ